MCKHTYNRTGSSQSRGHTEVTPCVRPALKISGPGQCGACSWGSSEEESTLVNPEAVWIQGSRGSEMGRQAVSERGGAGTGRTELVFNPFHCRDLGKQFGSCSVGKTCGSEVLFCFPLRNWGKGQKWLIPHTPQPRQSSCPLGRGWTGKERCRGNTTKGVRSAGFANIRFSMQSTSESRSCPREFEDTD